MYRNTTDFWIMFLYPANLLNLVISYNTFCVDSLGFSSFKIMLPANRESFTSFFTIWMLFILFSCLITLARASRAMLNRSGKSRHPCLVPDLREKVFRVWPMSIRYQDTSDSWNELGSVLTFSIFGKSLRSFSVNYSLNIWQNSPVKPFSLWLFIVESFWILIQSPYFLQVYSGLFSISSWVSSSSVFLCRNFFISHRLSNILAYNYL